MKMNEPKQVAIGMTQMRFRETHVLRNMKPNEIFLHSISHCYMQSVIYEPFPHPTIQFLTRIIFLSSPYCLEGGRGGELNHGDPI